MTRNEVNINTFTVIYSSGSQSTLRNVILNLWGLEPTDPNRARNQAVFPVVLPTAFFSLKTSKEMDHL